MEIRVICGETEILVHAFLLGGYVSFPDDETGEYFEIEKWSNVIILLHCQEITQKCLDKNKKGELEYWGEVDDTEYYIKLHVPSGPGFFDEYFKNEIMAIRPYH